MWKNKTRAGGGQGAGPRDAAGPRGGAAPRAATSKTLFSLQGPHRGARHAGPERPSCSLRVTKGPGATAEPHRAARAQHTLDSAIFTPGKRAEGGVAPGVRVRRAPAPPRPAARTRRTGSRGAPRLGEPRGGGAARARRARIGRGAASAGGTGNGPSPASAGPARGSSGPGARGRRLLERPSALVRSPGPRGWQALPLTSAGAGLGGGGVAVHTG